jgi:hypothetical protein
LDHKIFSLIDKAKLLAIDGIKVDFVELEQIEKIIALFHENKKRISK